MRASERALSLSLSLSLHRIRPAQIGASEYAHGIGSITKKRQAEVAAKELLLGRRVRFCAHGADLTSKNVW